jgi:hypothetical protein
MTPIPGRGCSFFACRPFRQHDQVVQRKDQAHIKEPAAARPLLAAPQLRPPHHAAALRRIHGQPVMHSTISGRSTAENQANARRMGDLEGLVFAHSSWPSWCGPPQPRRSKGVGPTPLLTPARKQTDIWSRSPPLNISYLEGFACAFHQSVAMFSSSRGLCANYRNIRHCANLPLAHSPDA